MMIFVQFVEEILKQFCMRSEIAHGLRLSNYNWE